MYNDNFIFLFQLLLNILNTILNNPSISIAKINVIYYPYIYKFILILINNLYFFKLN